MAADKLKVLFLCTGNSCRSQMAEGFAHALWGEYIVAHSAGIRSRGLDPLAVRVMAEIGVDISDQTSKTVDALTGLEFDYVITVCGNADEHCSVFPGGARRIHHAFDDPPALTAGLGDEAEILGVYRRVRDQVRAFVETLPKRLHERDGGTMHGSTPATGACNPA